MTLADNPAVWAGDYSFRASAPAIEADEVADEGDDDDHGLPYWRAWPAIPVVLFPTADPMLALHLRSITAYSDRIAASNSPAVLRSPSRDRLDFTDPESEAVLDAIADALVGPLARQAARDDFAAWLATQQGRR